MSAGVFLCRPPPWPISTRGAPWEPDTGDQSTPGISPTMKSRSTTPFDDVSAVKRTDCIGCCLSGVPCCRGAPGDPYVDRPTRDDEGSTHIDTAFMGLTS